MIFSKRKQKVRRMALLYIFLQLYSPTQQEMAGLCMNPASAHDSFQYVVLVKAYEENAAPSR